MRIELAVTDPPPRAHALERVGPDHAAVAEGVLVLEGAVEDVGDDFHVPVRVHGEPLPGADEVLVDDAQRPEAHVPRVVVVGEREAVLGVEPAVVRAAALRGRPHPHRRRGHRGAADGRRRRDRTGARLHAARAGRQAGGPRRGRRGLHHVSSGQVHGSYSSGRTAWVELLGSNCLGRTARVVSLGRGSRVTGHFNIKVSGSVQSPLPRVHGPTVRGARVVDVAPPRAGPRVPEDRRLPLPRSGAGARARRRSRAGDARPAGRRGHSLRADREPG